MTATFTALESVESLIARLADEGLIGASAAGRIINRHASTVTRWVLMGVRLDDGRQLRLEGFRCGGKVQTSRQALMRFLASQQAEPVTIQTPASRRRADREAERILDAAGI